MPEKGLKRVGNSLSLYKNKVESALASFVTSREGMEPGRLYEAMAYSLQAGGKRLRPALCLLLAETRGIPIERAMPLALSVEMIHTASLIHDDLPCMDNDEIRRGKPTNHVVYGEPLALLAGTALIVQAFESAVESLNAEGMPPAQILQAISILMHATGPSGIYGGQVLDIDVPSQRDDPAFVRCIAYSKTAVLIRAALLCGALAGAVSDSELRCYHNYGTHLGIAFQIVDDILDTTGSIESLGKTPGKDVFDNKRTFVTVYGDKLARGLAREESLRAKDALSPDIPERELLIDVVDYLIDRNR